MTTEDHTQPASAAQVAALTEKIDVLLTELLNPRMTKLAEGGTVDRPRGYTLGDQFMDLLKRHEQGQLTDAGFYEVLANMTGISLPDNEQVLQQFVGRDLNAVEAREAEAAGLLVVECTAASDPEPVFLADRAVCRPEQGHIVNTPRFQAALEDFRQKYEQGRLDEL